MNYLHKLLFVTGNKFRGYNVLQRIDQLKRMENWPLDRIEAWQLYKLNNLLKHAYYNVPFYNNHWSKAGINFTQLKTIKDLSLLPKVTKEDLRKAGDQALDSSRKKNTFLKLSSSGSTGEPFIYYMDKNHHSWFIAGGMLSWMWGGWNLGEPWIRFQFRKNYDWKLRIEDWLVNCLYMQMYNFSEILMEKFTEKAIKKNPIMIRGYSGIMYIYSKFLLNKGENRIRPMFVACTGDTLYPHYRETIEKAFDCPVFDAYGGEGMPTANQCESGCYHILPSMIVNMESEGKNLDEGQPGRLLLTSLTNFAMPMIQYDIADLGIMGEGECSCGRNWKFLNNILGRDTDIITTPSGNKLFCHHFNVALREIKGLDQYQVVQNNMSEITIQLQINPNYDNNEQEKEIISKVSRIADDDLKIILKYTDQITVPRNGKRRYIISKVGASA